MDDWMGNYPDKTLGEIIMPGSHDAGTYAGGSDLKGFGATAKNSITQTSSIPVQVTEGVRFFDLRLKATGKGVTRKVVAHHTTAGIGAYGSEAVDDILSAVSLWCKVHTSEIVIIRITHTDVKTGIADIVKNSDPGDRLHKSALNTNLCKKKLSEIAASGNLVVLLDEKKFSGHIDPTLGLHPFRKFKGMVTKGGIETCGIYQGGHALDDIVCAGLKGQYEHSQNHHADQHDHLFQVYWQKTYKNPLDSKGIKGGVDKKSVYRPSDGNVHGGTHGATKFLLQKMKNLGSPMSDAEERALFKGNPTSTPKTDWKLGKVGGFFNKKNVMYSTCAVRQIHMPNIVSYDFTNEETNKIIIGFNTPSLLAHQGEEI
jgi:hypothetical protein